MITLNPKKLKGNWFEGYALDYHTLSSTFLGYDEFGHEVFETIRSEVGELLYKLKYRSDRSVLNDIIEATIYFLKQEWNIVDILDGIIAMPPSNIRRHFQPVIEIARKLSAELQIPFFENSLRKTRQTPELKGIFEFEKRLELLQNNFSVEDKLINDRHILLFDDLFRSGATLNAATGSLYEKGRANRVYVLTLTKTRSLI